MYYIKSTINHWNLNDIKKFCRVKTCLRYLKKLNKSNKFSFSKLSLRLRHFEEVEESFLLYLNHLGVLLAERGAAQYALKQTKLHKQHDWTIWPEFPHESTINNPTNKTKQRRGGGGGIVLALCLVPHHKG